MRAPQFLVCAVSLALAGCATGSGPGGSAETLLPANLDPSQRRGHDFAVHHCSGCHAVSVEDAGARSGPDFRSLAVRYSPISLERRFTAVAQHGLDRMPPTPMTRGEAEDLIVYFNSLNGR